MLRNALACALFVAACAAPSPRSEAPTPGGMRRADVEGWWGMPVSSGAIQQGAFSYGFHEDGTLEFIMSTAPNGTGECRRLEGTWLYGQGRLTVVDRESPATNETFLVDAPEARTLRLVKPDGTTFVYRRIATPSDAARRCPPFEGLPKK